MNPFDGEYRDLTASLYKMLQTLTLLSDQAADAGSWLRPQDPPPVCAVSLQDRRSPSVLRLLPHHSVHDRPLHRDAVCRLRVDFQGHEPVAGL